LIVKDRLPRPTVINRFENPAVYRRHVKDIRLRRHTADCARPATAVRANISPTQKRIELPGTRQANPKNDCETDCNCVSNQPHKPPFSYGNTAGAIPLAAEPLLKLSYGNLLHNRLYILT
jgi:hypothetical protein